MKAYLKPLKGKYYGTHLVIVDDDLDEYTLEVWDSSKQCPSQRELETWGYGEYTPQDWLNGTIAEDIDGEEVPLHHIVDICDSHYEDEGTYQVCKKIMDLINNS